MCKCLLFLHRILLLDDYDVYKLSSPQTHSIIYRHDIYEDQTILHKPADKHLYCSLFQCLRPAPFPVPVRPVPSSSSAFRLLQVIRIHFLAIDNFPCPSSAPHPPHHVLIGAHFDSSHLSQQPQHLIVVKRDLRLVSSRFHTPPFHIVVVVIVCLPINLFVFIPNTSLNSPHPLSESSRAKIFCSIAPPPSRSSILHFSQVFSREKFTLQFDIPSQHLSLQPTPLRFTILLLVGSDKLQFHGVICKFTVHYDFFSK